jgi:hypothetical protein
MGLVSLKAQTSAKNDVNAQATKNELTNGAAAGTPLPATINVTDNVNIEAVMLPYEISRHVFGKEVADNYAVIEVNISNRSNEAALIVQSLFIDLHDWGLAGPMDSLSTSGDSDSPSKTFQAKASPLEVSSVEYRIVRGELLDRQPWTKRNVGLRVIQVLGSLGTAFAFPFTKDVVTGIDAWNGAVVPGYQALFPDSLQGQIDRISDYGFRNNKVIPQQAADVLVAFFPIKRFLTPTLRMVFLENPALFFNPLLMMLDPKTRPLFDPALIGIFKTKQGVDDAFQALLAAFEKVDSSAVAADRELVAEDLANIKNANAAISQDMAAIAQDKANPKPDAAVTALHQAALETDNANLAKYEALRVTHRSALDAALKPLADDKLYPVLSKISLNNVHVVLSGIMTIDVDNVPPIITSFSCTNDDQPALIWAAAGDRTCAIHGSFLSSGTPAIAEASALGLSVGAVAANSTDALLNIKLTLTKVVPPKTTLTFQVSKKNKQGSTVESMKFAYTVPDYTLPAPSISGVTVKDTTVTVAGANFYDISPTWPLTVTAHPVAPKSVGGDQKIEKPTATLTNIEFDDKSLAAACWQVQVKVGTVEAPASGVKPPKDEFALVKIDSAKLNGSTLTVDGGGFADLGDCGGPVTFEVLSTEPNAAAQPITKADTKVPADGKSATLTMPALAPKANWKEVHALLSGKQVATAPIQ